MSNMLVKHKWCSTFLASGMFNKGASIKSVAVVSLVISGLTACGGAASQLDDAMTPVPAAATAANADENVLKTMPTEEDAAQLPVATQDEVVELIEVPYQANQAVIDAAVNVGCSANTEEFSVTMLELINASRTEARMCGTGTRNIVGVLSWNNTLSEAALAHANDMEVNNFFSHTGSDGLQPRDRVDTAGYSWLATGENIAAGQPDVAEVHQGWLDSPAHCDNIMNEIYTEVGAVCVESEMSNYPTYWVVVFGDPK